MVDRDELHELARDLLADPQRMPACIEIDRLRAALAGVLNCIGNLEVDRLQMQMIREAREALERR